MSFTYNMPALTDIDRVRLIIQDTNSTNYSFSNEEIEEYLSIFGSIIQACIMICYSYSTKYAINSSEEFQVDDIRLREGKDKANNFIRIAKALEDRIKSGVDTSEGAIFYFGGVYESETASNKESQDNNTIVDNPFYNGVFDTVDNNTINE